MKKLLKKKWIKYSLGIILPTIVLASTYPYYLINNNELSTKQVEVNNTFNKSKSLKTQDNVSATNSSASFPVKDIKITEINKLLSKEASSLGSLNIYFENNQTFPLFDVNDKTLTLNPIDRNQNSLANQLWTGDLKGSNNETFKSFFDASFKNNYVDKIGTENEKGDFREYSNSLSIQQYSNDNPNTIPIDLILDEGRKSVTIDNPDKNSDFKIEQGSPLVLGLTNGYAIYDKYDSDNKIFQDQNLDLKPSFSFIDNNYLSREKILYSAIDNHKGFVGFQSSLFLIYDVDDNDTLKIYFVKNDNNNINDGKTSFDSCDFTFPNKSELTPSEVIKNIDQYKQYFNLNSSYTLPSTLNKNITLTANDANGTISVTIPEAPGIEFIKRDVVITDGDNLHPLIGDNNSGKNIAMKLIKTEQKTLEINGFRSGDNNTKTVSEYSVKDDRNIARYSIDEFLQKDLLDQQELIKNFIYNKRTDIFNVLPSSFTIDDIIKDSISLTKKDNNNTQGNLSFKIKNYYINNLPVIDPTYLDVNLTLTDFSKGSTILNEKLISLVNFQNYYAQGSILRSSTQAQQNIPKVFDQQYVINNNESPLQLRGSDLNPDFLQQVFEKCFGGNIEGITGADITAIKIKYFDNKEGKIAISGIYLNKLYDTSIQDGIITKPNNWIFDDENDPIIVSGFKPMDQAAFTLKNEIDIPNVSDEKPSSYNKNKLLNLLLTLLKQNKQLIYSNTLPESFNFQYDTKYLIGQITDLQFTSDPINGIITASNIKVKNLLIKSDINHDQIVFVNEYTFNQSITLKGFYAENQTTIFTIDGNWTNYLPSDIYYGWKYKNQYPNENQVLKNFLIDFYTNNIKYPGAAKADNLSIEDFEDVDNAKGKIKVKLELTNGLINGQSGTVTSDWIILNNFKTQGPTEWIGNNIPLQVEGKVNIYDFKNIDIRNLIFQNQEKWIKNPPPDFKVYDIELQRIYGKDDNSDHFKVDPVNKKIIFKPQLKRWFNSKGMPNWYDNETKENKKRAEYEYEITGFFVNEYTKENYRYEYNVNLPDETIKQSFFNNPNELKEIVLESLKLEKTKGLSIPSIQINDFDLALEEKQPSDETKNFLYGSGEINLKIILKKYYTKDGKESTPNDQPINLFVKVDGWKKYTTDIQANSFDWGNGFNSSVVNETFVKDLIWQNRNNLLTDYLFENDEAKFKDNFIIDIKPPRVSNNLVSFRVEIQQKEYFLDGEYKNDSKWKKEIIINGFTPKPPKTEFVDNKSIPAKLKILPSYLEKNWQSELDFKTFVIREILSGDKAGITVNDIKSISFSDPNNAKGTIKIANIKVLGYNDSFDKTEITYNFQNLTITDLAQSEKTKLIGYEIENKTGFKNLFYINNEQLTTIVKESYTQIFNQLPNGKNSIEKVELKNPSSFDNSDTFLNGQIYVKITLNSWFNDDGLEQSGELTFGEKEDIKITSFDKPQPTQVPKVINFDMHNLPDFTPVNISIFDKSVIDNNWPRIQKWLADVLNITYKNDPYQWVSVIPTYDKDTNEYIIAPYYDSVRWNFSAKPGSDGIDYQKTVKDALVLAASKALHQPDQYNNGSLGRIQVKVKLLRGFRLDNNNQIEYTSQLSDQQGSILINLYGFKSTDDASSILNKSNSNVILWASIGSTIGGLSLIIALVIVFTILMKKRNKNN